MDENKIICGDCLEVMKDFPDSSVDLVVTSPPYWAMRNYGIDGQLGQEETFEEYIEKLILITGEIKRVLHKKGSFFVNLSDVYGGSNAGRGTKNMTPKQASNKGTRWMVGRPVPHYGVPNKSLCLIPQRFAIRMVDEGWILRNIIIWHKPNAMPTSAKDRFTVDFEYVYFFVKQQRYYFEQILEPYTKPLNRWAGDNLKATGISEWSNKTGQNIYRDRNMRPNPLGKNKRTVWSINTSSTPEEQSNFAVYPEELVWDIIKACCSLWGITFDPFCGSGTTCVVAKKLGRRYIGIDISEKYCQIARERLRAVDTGVPVKEARSGQGGLFE